MNYLGDVKSKTVEVVPWKIAAPHNWVAAWLNGEVYVFSALNCSMQSFSIEKYSPVTKTWCKVAEALDYNLDNIFAFCHCSFINKLFLVGGYTESMIATDLCSTFNANDNSWRAVTGMEQVRFAADCTVFDGQVVVAGGMDENETPLKTVQRYDVTADVWQPMASMNEAKKFHKLVAVKNKLFAIGRIREGCEVFDKASDRFAYIEQPKKGLLSLKRVISIGNKIIVFNQFKSYLDCYDFDKKKWHVEPCEATKKLFEFSVVKIPCE